MNVGSSRPPLDQRKLARLRDVLSRLGLLGYVEGELDRHGVALVSMLSDSRNALVTTMRFWLWSMMRDQAGWSFPMLGDLFNRDHTTILQGIRSFRAGLDKGHSLFMPGPRPNLETSPASTALAVLPISVAEGGVMEISSAQQEADRVARFIQARADHYHRHGQGNWARELETLAGQVRRREHAG